MVRVWDSTETAALVALLRARPGGIRLSRIPGEVEAAGSALAVWSRAMSGGGETGQLVLDAHPTDPLDAPAYLSATTDLAQWIASGLIVLSFMDSEYPAQLRGVHQRPPLLFARGHLRAGDEGVCVIGSRAASDAGLRLAANVAHGLVDAGSTVVSGLAAGVDSAAHTAALAAGGRTVAVIGTGIRKHYPATNSELQEQIAARGLVLSQFWPDEGPAKHAFLMRNAVMSGYGRANIVIEAGESSGAAAQARISVDHGRPLILSTSVARTTWGRELMDLPGTHVGSSATDLVELALAHSRPVDGQVLVSLP